MRQSHRNRMRLVGLCGLALALEACGGLDSTALGTEVQPAAPGEQGSSPIASGPVASSPAPALDGADEQQVVESEHVKTVRGADGSYTSEVDATSMESWVYFSLRGSAEVTPAVPEQSDSWDLGFQRSNVKLNGGASGVAGVAVSVASGSFEAVLEPPAEGYAADADDADMDGSPDYALSAGDGWYEYDPASHRLSARSSVFVLRTPGGHFKLQFSSYYDAAGTPGVPQFRWAPLGS